MTSTHTLIRNRSRFIASLLVLLIAVALLSMNLDVRKVAAQNSQAQSTIVLTATACSCLTAFTNECHALSGKILTPAQSTQLINSANQIKSDLGCP